MMSGVLLIATLAMQFSCSVFRQSEIERNRLMWRTSGITNYRMLVDLRKTGHASPNGKFVIIVRRGVVESIKLANDPEFDLSKSVIKFGRYVTIDDVFDYIETMEWETWNWHTREIQYDSKLGYPKKVNLDASRVFDEELFYQILEFEVIE